MKYFFALLVIFIAGCTSTTRQTVDFETNAISNSWQLKGRLAAKIDQKGGSASFIWLRSQDDHSIELYGPLGSGRVFLKQSQGQASLIDNKTQYSGESLEQVLFQRVGWLVPFDDMQNWIVGQPEARHIANVHYENDKLTEFTQSGWHVSYDKFTQHSSYELPSKITITAQPSYLDELSGQLGRTIEQVRVKLIIKQFTAG